MKTVFGAMSDLCGRGFINDGIEIRLDSVERAGTRWERVHWHERDVRFAEWWQREGASGPVKRFIDGAQVVA